MSQIWVTKFYFPSIKQIFVINYPYFSGKQPVDKNGIYELVKKCIYASQSDLHKGVDFFEILVKYKFWLWNVAKTGGKSGFCLIEPWCYVASIDGDRYVKFFAKLDVSVSFSSKKNTFALGNASDKVNNSMGADCTAIRGQVYSFIPFTV